MLPRTHAQAVKQSVCMSVVENRCSGDLGNNDESVDIGEELVPARLKSLKLACTTNHAFSVHYACGSPTTPALLACDATVHARA